MGFLETVIMVVLVVLVVMTAFAEPKTSFEYGKAMLKSGKVLFVKIKDGISDWRDRQNSQEVVKDEKTN